MSKGEVELFKFRNLSKHIEIKHFITSRKGGVSAGAYDSLNIGFGTNDFSINVLENRHRMAVETEIPLDSFIMANQVHGTNIEIVTGKYKGMGAFYRDNALKATDAMITNQSEICLFIMNADCVPVLFYDPGKKVIGAAHAGWRGTVNKIAALTIKKMEETFGCNPSDILVGIGPSIGPCCYEVGEDVVDHVYKNFGNTKNFVKQTDKSSKFILDLWYTNEYQLIEAGVKPDSIEVSNICTLCNKDKFFSSRGGEGDTGRFGAGIMLL
jgi:YfiH family protein